MELTAIVDTTTQSQIDFSFRQFRIKRLEIINYLLTKRKVLVSSSLLYPWLVLLPHLMVEVAETKCEHCSILTIFLILYEIEWKLQKRNWVKRTFPLAGSGDAIVNKAAKLSIKKFIFLFSKLLNTAVGKVDIFGGAFVNFVSL